MKSLKLTAQNYTDNMKNKKDVVPVFGKHYNNLKDDFDAHITSDGEMKADTISEYTSGSGITVGGVLLSDNSVWITAEDIVANTGGDIPQLDGTESFIVVTNNSDVNDIVHLPDPSDDMVGKVIEGFASGGFELTVPTQDESFTINGTTISASAEELAISAGDWFKAICISNTAWVVISEATGTPD